MSLVVFGVRGDMCGLLFGEIGYIIDGFGRDDLVVRGRVGE